MGGYWKWWPRLDLNQRPLPCQGSALPTELRDQQKRNYTQKFSKRIQKFLT